MNQDLDAHDLMALRSFARRSFVLPVALLALGLSGCVAGVGEAWEEDVDEAEIALLANNAHHNGFQLTNYIVAQESQLAGQHTGDSSFICPPGLNGNCYRKEFLCSGWGVPMQGTGLASDGKYIKYVGGGGPWSSGYTWWQNCGSTTFAYVNGVTGASGRTLVANYSIAVDPGYIALGSYVWIDSHNHWFRADDTGGAIDGYHLDIYTGTSNPLYNSTSGIYLTQTVRAMNDPSPYSAPPAEVIVDDQQSGFSRYGTGSWTQASYGYGSHMWYITVNGTTQNNYGRWKPALPGAGSYKVYAHIPSNHANSKKAPYKIYHQGTNDYARVDHSIYSNQWVLLGTWSFSGDGTEFVQVGDNSGEAASTSLKVGLDAVKFVKQ
ncbi:golvesin C-terminal-like domain-containing protein [Chondromyces apiculatus]|uniref:Uncharacterized protein n=1 Tax=Chondromyces apiculatus DSM 436 TaxID=1192034 RepID=A0A017T1M0_9BACT|nr:3D domain-containing protein [Chondromyces apiculatus]EYF02892.1 Hypothetical protein CAP_6472 [Chondromyces apiculatus DSM 436]